MTEPLVERKQSVATAAVPAAGAGGRSFLAGWSRPELLAVAALLVVIISGTGWLAWDRLGGWSDSGAAGRAAGASGSKSLTAGASGTPGAGQSGAGAGAQGGAAAGGDGSAPEAGSAGVPEGAAGGGKAAAAITVHVVGAVLHPGVYRLPPGSRAVDAVTAAGGQRADGRSDLLNLAAALVDGDKVYVPSQRDVDGAGQGGTGSAGGGGWTMPGQGGKVDVNHADLQTLETLPGVGPSLAAAILRYRQEHGPFRAVQDLEKVPGIGPAKLAALRDRVVLR